MTRLSERFKKKDLSTYSLIDRYGLCSIASIIVILFIGIIVPELVETSFAVEDPVQTGISKINLSLHSTNSTDPTKYEVSFMRRRESPIQFGTLGIVASVSNSDIQEYGYTLTMRSEDRLGRLVHSDSDLRETNYVSPIEESFTVDLKAVGGPINPFITTAVNHYGYSMDWDTTDQTGTFYPIPATETVIRRKTQKDTPAQGSDLPATDDTTVTLGFGVNENLMFGNYTGKLIFTAYSNGAHNIVDHFRLSLEPGDGTTPLHMPSASSLEYVPSVSGTPTTQHDFSLASVFETLPVIQATDLETLELAGGTMQDLTPEICANSPVADSEGNHQYTLRDARDGKTYRVAHLATGECWMTQNLALGGSAAITLTPADSDVAANYTLPVAQTKEKAKEGADEPKISWASDNIDAKTAHQASTTTINDAQVYSGDSNHVYATANADYGNYYTWFTATASTGGALTANQSTATESICPKGWRLPTQTELTSLNANSSALTGAPYYYTFSGSYDTGILGQGTAGGYWTSEAASASNSYNESIASTASIANSPRYTGYAVRCVMDAALTPSTDTQLVHTFRGLNDTPAFFAGNNYYEWNFTTSQYELQSGANNTTPLYHYQAGTWTSPETDDSDNPVVRISTADTKVETVAYTTYEKQLYIVWEQPSWDAAFMINNISAQKKEIVPDSGFFSSHFKMQDMTGDVCSRVTTNQDLATSLVDARDNKLYSVIKAKDGNCWMTQNLALGTTAEKTWYFNTTNLPSDNVNAYSVKVPTSVAWTKVAAADPVPEYYYAAWNQAYSTNNMMLFAYTDYFTADSYTTKYGNFYSARLAIANQSDYGNNTTDSNTGSICAKGWMLPSATHYSTLLGNYTAPYTAGPLNFVKAGKIIRPTDDTKTTADENEDGRTATQDRTGIVYQGDYGMYWTKTNATNNGNEPLNTDADLLLDNKAQTSGGVNRILLIDGDGNANIDTAVLHRGNGASIRCLADAKNNFYLYLDGNGGIIPASSMTLSTNDPSATFTLSTNSSYIPYRDSWNETKMNGAITEFYRHSYTFLGWHTSPVVDGTPTSIADVQAAMEYPYTGSAFMKNGSAHDTVTVSVSASNPTGRSRVLYAIWAENVILERVDNPNLDPTPGQTHTPGETTTTPIHKDDSSKDYVDPYGEDTIDDDIPAAVLRIVKLIRALPDAALVSLEYGAQITEVRDAYEALTSSEKAMIGSSLTTKYNSVLTAYYSLLEADSTGSNIFIAALVGAAVSTVAFTTFIIVKKEKENEEEEEE